MMKNKTLPPTPAAPAKASPYSRFIPREELSSFSAWDPGSIADSASADAPPAPRSGLRRATDRDAQGAEPADDAAALAQAARQSGYQDGYRDGLAALEGFKQSVASQITAQVGVLMGTLGRQLDAMEKDMARCLAESATQLAEQIVRSEISQRPELVQAVAREATEALLRSASQITLRVHPDDLALVADGAGDVLEARGARLIADKSITRGGCLVESDIGKVDATIQARWRQCVASLGSDREWDQAASDDADSDAAPAGAGQDLPT